MRLYAEGRLALRADEWRVGERRWLSTRPPPTSTCSVKGSSPVASAKVITIPSRPAAASPRTALPDRGIHRTSIRHSVAAPRRRGRCGPPAAARAPRRRHVRRRRKPGGCRGRSQLLRIVHKSDASSCSCTSSDGAAEPALQPTAAAAAGRSRAAASVAGSTTACTAEESGGRSSNVACSNMPPTGFGAEGICFGKGRKLLFSTGTVMRSLLHRLNTYGTALL